LIGAETGIKAIAAAAQPMSAFGHKRTYAVHKAMSALPPIATSIASSKNPVDSPCSRRSFWIFDFEQVFDAPYKSGPSKAWLKIKKPKTPAATSGHRRYVLDKFSSLIARIYSF
jgi:hypothetical protein